MVDGAVRTQGGLPRGNESQWMHRGFEWAEALSRFGRALVYTFRGEPFVGYAQGGHAVEERRTVVRRRADRELLEFVEKKTGQPARQVLRDRKLRHAVRHTCKAVMEVEVAHASGATEDRTTDTQILRSRVLDLSPGGAALFTKCDFQLGSEFRLGVKLYDGQTIEAQAIVRWSKYKQAKEGYAIGVEFTEIDAPNQKRLDTFLAELDATLGM